VGDICKNNEEIEIEHQSRIGEDIDLEGVGLDRKGGKYAKSG
jgi:hypothetical protein